MIGGFSMVVVALLQAVVVFLPGRRERPPSLRREGVILPVLLATQGVLGVYRVLELHVPIGVLMAVGAFHGAAWAWRTPLPQRPGAARDSVEAVAA
jgi:heme A synthase